MVNIQCILYQRKDGRKQRKAEWMVLFPTNFSFISIIIIILFLTYICKNHYFHCLAKCVLYIYLKKSLELLIFKEFVKLRYEAMFLPVTYYNQSWGDLA